MTRPAATCRMGAKMTTTDERCSRHGGVIVFCPITATWSAADVMSRCGCVLYQVTVNGITARVHYRVRAKKATKPSKEAA